MMLADRLSIDPNSKRELAVAALLVDIGKVGVRQSALCKGGHLDEVERESLRQSPQRSAFLLSGLPSLRGAARIVRHHHEKYDGSGFPEGLRGERIPVRSRILAIADAYDLLTSPGQQGEAMSWPEALDRMHEDRGEHFDPDILDLFEEEIRKSPLPSESKSRVLISNSGVLPYKLGEEPRAIAVEEAEDSESLLAYGEEELELYGDEGEGRLG
ncbi:MAG: HD-GYP domain-containing protein [Planctomycetota bacterium]|jgi:HD-GYP domain-containing protein (c-di-GMP phosphodiesterase class II)